MSFYNTNIYMFTYAKLTAEVMRLWHKYRIYTLIIRIILPHYVSAENINLCVLLKSVIQISCLIYCQWRLIIC